MVLGSIEGKAEQEDPQQPTEKEDYLLGIGSRRGSRRLRSFSFNRSFSPLEASPRGRRRYRSFRKPFKLRFSNLLQFD